MCFALAMGGFVFAGGEGEDGANSVVETIPGYSVANVAGAINVQWKVDGENLLVQMTAATTGWVAVGFDPSNKMKDANIVIGYVKDGTVSLRDDYGIGPVKHGPDVDNGGSDNLSGVEGTESDGVTTLRFSIPLDSGDSADKKLEPGRKYKIIASHGPDEKDDFGSYHATRGSAEINL